MYQKINDCQVNKTKIRLQVFKEKIKRNTLTSNGFSCLQNLMQLTQNRREMLKYISICRDKFQESLQKIFEFTGLQSQQPSQRLQTIFIAATLKRLLRHNEQLLYFLALVQMECLCLELFGSYCIFNRTGKENITYEKICI